LDDCALRTGGTSDLFTLVTELEALEFASLSRVSNEGVDCTCALPGGGRAIFNSDSEAAFLCVHETEDAMTVPRNSPDASRLGRAEASADGATG